MNINAINAETHLNSLSSHQMMINLNALHAARMIPADSCPHFPAVQAIPLAISAVPFHQAAHRQEDFPEPASSTPAVSWTKTIATLSPFKIIMPG